MIVDPKKGLPEITVLTFFAQKDQEHVGGARWDQGPVGQRLEGPWARWTALGRTKGTLVVSHEDNMRSQGGLPGRTKGTFGGASEDDNRSSQYLT